MTFRITVAAHPTGVEAPAGLDVPEAGEVTLGADPACDLCLPGRGVAEVHASLGQSDGDALLTLEAAAELNGHPCAPGAHALADGDSLAFGGYRLQVWRAEPGSGFRVETDLAGRGPLVPNAPIEGPVRGWEAQPLRARFDRRAFPGLPAVDPAPPWRTALAAALAEAEDPAGLKREVLEVLLAEAEPDPGSPPDPAG